MSIKLSILIPSINPRKDLLIRLLNCLKINNKPVEIIASIDNCELTIGEKRNKLIEQSSGEYIVFIDDDDLVTDNYVDLILSATKENPDVISIEGLYYNGNRPSIRFKHKLNTGWVKEGSVLVRPPTHICPIKRDIAIKCKFTEKNFGEDKDYANKILELIKTEFHISKPIYRYLFNRIKEYDIKKIK